MITVLVIAWEGMDPELWGWGGIVVHKARAMAKLRERDHPGRKSMAWIYTSVCGTRRMEIEELAVLGGLVGMRDRVMELCKDLYAQVGSGSDLGWHLQEQGYADRLKAILEE